mmetsp:Transcript_66759/g.195923  ORF Transcript_66759/g.195923 Transcript_66759/m.195923 type:complete len:247 (+) Transcript_66759:859-1599(+)
MGWRSSSCTRTTGPCTGAKASPVLWNCTRSSTRSTLRGMPLEEGPRAPPTTATLRRSPPAEAPRRQLCSSRRSTPTRLPRPCSSWPPGCRRWRSWWTRRRRPRKPADPPQSRPCRPCRSRPRGRERRSRRRLGQQTSSSSPRRSASRSRSSSSRRTSSGSTVCAPSTRSTTRTSTRSGTAASPSCSTSRPSAPAWTRTTGLRAAPTRSPPWTSRSLCTGSTAAASRRTQCSRRSSAGTGRTPARWV